jgi:hypothetical protein
MFQVQIGRLINVPCGVDKTCATPSYDSKHASKPTCQIVLKCPGPRLPIAVMQIETRPRNMEPSCRKRNRLQTVLRIQRHDDTRLAAHRERFLSAFDASFRSSRRDTDLAAIRATSPSLAENLQSVSLCRFFLVSGQPPTVIHALFHLVRFHVRTLAVLAVLAIPVARHMNDHDPDHMSLGIRYQYPLASPEWQGNTGLPTKA